MNLPLVESSNSKGGGGSTALLGISLELVGWSSDMWNTGWMRDRARDKPSRNTVMILSPRSERVPGSDVKLSWRGEWF